MPTKQQFKKIGTAQNRKSWAAFSLLVAVALIPSTCVWWLVIEASESKHLAMQQLQADAQNSYLETGSAHVSKTIADLRFTLDSITTETSPIQQEYAVLQQTNADAYYSLNSPNETRDSKSKELDTIKQAIREERSSDALTLISESLDDPQTLLARSKDGRMITPLLLLLAIDLTDNVDAKERNWDALRSFMLSNQASLMPISQRHFYLKKLSKQHEDAEVTRLLLQVTTASEWLDQVQEKRENLPPFSQSEDFITIRSTVGNAFIVYRTHSFQTLLSDSLKTLPNRGGGSLSVKSPTSEIAISGTTLSIQLHQDLADWELVFSSDADSDSTRNADREVLLLIIVGVIVVLLSFGLSFALYRVMRRQADLTQLKNDLIATVSHELKTPISSIRLLVDILQKKKTPSPDRVRDYLELISNENKRLGRLVENFLSFSRMERNKSSFDLQEVSPETIAQEAHNIFLENLTNHEVQLQLKIEDGLRPIMADAEAMQTAIGNLLDNANKYGGPNAEIELSVTANKQGIVFTVSDRGEGVPKEEQSKIFERFYQSKRRLSEHAGGVGLGLSIVSFIVDGHSGHIDLVSSPSNGSQFSISIPYA